MDVNVTLFLSLKLYGQGAQNDNTSQLELLTQFVYIFVVFTTDRTETQILYAIIPGVLLWFLAIIFFELFGFQVYLISFI